MFPKLKLNYVLMRSTIEEILDFVDLARECGADEVRFQHHLIVDDSHRHEALWFDKELSNQYLSKAIAKCEAYGIQVDAPPLFELTPDSNDKSLRTPHCSRPWTWMMIESNYTIIPCCQWRGPKLGDILEQGFEAVWNGEAYRQLRMDWITGDLNPHCRDCSILMEGDVNDFRSFFDYEYEIIHDRKPALTDEEKRQAGVEPA